MQLVGWAELGLLAKKYFEFVRCDVTKFPLYIHLQSVMALWALWGWDVL